MKNIYRSPTRIFKHLRKKAQEGPEAQFNWIFILIVGALIIAFFTLIVIKQKGASEVKVSGTLTKQLNTIFVGARVSSGTVQEIPTPKFAVRFTCNDYYIGAVGQRLGNRVLFAPENLEGNRIITWTRDWSVPYKVTTFLYVTNPNTRYVLVRVSGVDEQAFKQLNITLPVKLNRNFDLIEYDPIEGSPYMELKKKIEDHTRFVFVGGDNGFDPVVPPDFVDRKGSAVQFFSAQNKIRFFELSGDRFNDLTGASLLGPSGPIPYLNYDTLLGAVFADDPKIYACTVDKAWTSWNIVTKVFIEKFNSIAPTYQGTACEGFYKDNFDLLAVRDTTEHGFNLESSGLESDLGDLSAAITSLGRTNERAQLSSCPLIY